MSYNDAGSKYHHLAEQARVSAEALDNAQRALNHLDGLRSSWEEMSDAERLVVVDAAINRLSLVGVSDFFYVVQPTTD